MKLIKRTKKTNNESLDSLILISSSNLNQIDQEFYLISLQKTINKTGNKLKCPMDYCNATIEAAKLLETIYKIKIKNKYFLFLRIVIKIEEIPSKVKFDGFNIN